MASDNRRGSSHKGFSSSNQEKNDKGMKKTAKGAYNKKNYKSSPNVLFSTDDNKGTLFQLTATSGSGSSSNPSYCGNNNFQYSVTKHQSNSKHAASACATNPNQPVSMLKKNSKQASSKIKINIYDIKNQETSANSVHLESPQCMSLSSKEYDVKPALKQTPSPKHFQRNPQNVFRHPGPRMQTPRPYGRGIPPQFSPRNSFQTVSRFQQPRQNLQSQHGHNFKFQQTEFNSNKSNLHVQKNSRFPRTPPTYGNNSLSYCIQNSQSHIPNNQHRSNVDENITAIKASDNLNIPAIKFKKKNIDPSNKNLKKSKKNKSKNSSSERKRNREKKNNISGKEPDTSNVIPLLSFTKMTSEPEENCDLMQFSDDDYVNLSQNSVDSSAEQNFNLIDFSDDSEPLVPLQSVHSQSENLNLIDFSGEINVVNQFAVDNVTTQNFSDEDSDSSYDSDESEMSVNSSIIDTAVNISTWKANATKEEAFISVFWDIENCKLPAKKSAVDFTNYVRRTFYEGRTEESFTAACDVSFLSSVVVRELDEASVTLIHISSSNKNAADKKIMSLLQRFQNRHRKTNSAIVLVSGDSDFSQILLEMRYQHHIFINLICNSSTRRSLITAADRCEDFDDIMNRLSDRNVTDKMHHILLITNLPDMQPKLIKSTLSEKLKSFNGKINFSNTATIEVIFKDRSVCEKAKSFLKGYYLGGKLVNVAYTSKLTGDKTAVPKKMKKGNTQSSSFNLGIANVPKCDPLSFVDKKSTGATLCVFVSMYLGDVEYWKKAFEKICNTSEFSLLWEGSTFDGYFLIHFKSLKKAQKAKKVLEKNQSNDLNAPRFFKLIKHDEDLGSLKINVCSVEESNKRKIAEHIQVIEKRKMKYLRSHENVMKTIRSQTTSSVHGASEAVAEKLNECKEQMETFNSFTKRLVILIKVLNCTSEDFGQKLNELLCDFTRECNCISSALPIYAKKDLILKKIQEHQVVIIRAETGSGKSTQLTQYLWRERNSFGNGKIICTQPRKIAAVSLAKHVSSQIGSKLGDIVGYQVGMSHKMSGNTGILYVTDFTMLKVLVSEGLSNISCVIIDEAHERTIYTDILLGMIKKYLPSYPHIKIVITSATIDTSIFRDYFNLTESSVLQISGRMFPVQDVWFESDVKSDWDYFSKTIHTAFEILAEEPGDILAFLVTPLETEKACVTFNEKIKGSENCKKVKVFNLHGRLDSQEQQKVFEKTPDGMRKIVFATNCAETSITIPGIRYVIDCGLVKESQYDGTRNMNVLSVSFVSKSSAEQRRGRAGRTQVGKCYRLYSKANYEHMTDISDPEILRINLGQALLKLMKMGISDPVQFDFVQSPPVHLLNSTMDQLLYLKAVDESTRLLTDLGNKMAVLPLEPRLCHLILKGFDNDLGHDALAIAALITVSSTIFFRNSENKDEADKLKRRFCESENDYFTYLDVYKEWVDIPKNTKSQWCGMNCINARSMKIAHELINEITLILQRELSYKVRSKFKDNSNDTLLKIIFHSFSQNLAVFSGHFKFGYKSSSLSDRLLIHPGSSVSAFCQSTPQFVVYDTILKTTQTFIVNVCPVTRSLILDGISTHNLRIDMKALEDMIASVYSISPLGQSVIVNNFIGKKGIKRKELEKKVKVLSNSDFVEIDINVPKGFVQVIGYGIKDDAVEAVVSPIMEAAQEKLLKQEKDVCLFEDTSPFTAILVAGGHFKDVVLPGEFRDIKVILKGEESIQSVTEKLNMCGSIVEIREWKKYFKITFEIPSSAKKALETYTNESGFTLQSIERNIPGNNHDYRVFISFLRRKCTGCAFISLDQNGSIVGMLPSTISYRGSLAKVSRSKKSNDICIFGLPADTDKKDLLPVIVSAFPSEWKISKFIVVRSKPCESSEEEINILRAKIYNLFAEFTYKENIKVELKKPLPKDFTWNATVYFINALDGETAVNVLKNRKTHVDFIGGIMLKPTAQTYLYCKPEVFSVVKDEVEEALKFFQSDLSVGSSLDIIAVPKGTDRVEVKITSNNISDLADARRSLHTIISGDEIKFPNNSDKEKLFTDLGKDYIRKLSTENEDCYIFQNMYSKTITVFGKVNACNVIKMQINSFLKALENEECKDISLKTESGKSVLKELYKNYGFDFQKMKEEFGITDIQVNKYKQILTIQGNLSSVSKCESVIQEMKTKLNTQFSEIIEELCPVCCDEVSEEKYRLEYCGHSYCIECLLHLLQSSEDIPLKCEKTLDEHDSEGSVVCNFPIVVADIIWAINGRKPLQKTLYEKLLRSFVENRDDISYCPSPDCSMIFRVTKDKMNIFKCPACNNNICTRCEELYHCGMSCGMHQCLNSKKDYSLKVWMEEDPSNRKMCPSCSAPIEKNGGCNHMTCWKCKCHMCWLCLQVFPDSNLVYSHQPYCPKF